MRTKKTTPKPKKTVAPKETSTKTYHWVMALWETDLPEVITDLLRLGRAVGMTFGREDSPIANAALRAAGETAEKILSQGEK